jgi:hypothetical protein
MQRQGEGVAEVSPCRDKWISRRPAAKSRRVDEVDDIRSDAKYTVNEIVSKVIGLSIVAYPLCVARALLQLRRVEQGEDTCCFAAPTSSVCSLR